MLSEELASHTSTADRTLGCLLRLVPLCVDVLVDKLCLIHQLLGRLSLCLRQLDELGLLLLFWLVFDQDIDLLLTMS